jgi:hypothetical protein
MHGGDNFTVFYGVRCSNELKDCSIINSAQNFMLKFMHNTSLLQER